MEVVKEGRLGRPPNRPILPSSGQNHPRLPSLEGNLGQKRQNRPRLPSLEGNLGQPPALEKKEGGKHFCLQGGQSGTLFCNFPHGAKKEGEVFRMIQEGNMALFWQSQPPALEKKEGGSFFVLFRVDLVFSGLRVGKMGCGLRFFCRISGKLDLSRVDLVFFCRHFRLVSCGLRQFFCGLKADKIDLSRVDLDLYQFVVLIMRLTNLFNKSE